MIIIKLNQNKSSFKDVYLKSWMSNCGDVIWTMWETSSQKCLITSRLEIIEINNLYFYIIFGKLLREKTAQAYDFALEKIGLDVQSYSIWVDYINFLKSVYWFFVLDQIIGYNSINWYDIFS